MFLQRGNFAKMMSGSLISKEISQLSENKYSDVHRLHLGKNADGENERIENHLLETKQTTFHLHN